MDAYPLDGEQRDSIAEESDLEEVQAVGGYHDGRDYGRHIEQLSIVITFVDSHEIGPNSFSD